MSFNRYAIVCVGLLFGGLVQTFPAADPGPLNADAVGGLSLEALSKILASTKLRRLPLRLVLDERISTLSPENKKAVRLIHHVLMIDPGSERLRYDKLDYGPAGNVPYVCSSFTDGVHSGRWESGLKPEDVPLLLKGDSESVERRGMLYAGPGVCYSPDLVLRVMGLTMSGRPLAASVGKLGDDAVLTPDAAGDGVLVETKFRKLIFDAQGGLRQCLMFESDPEGRNLTIKESILVTETGKIGAIPVPTKMHRRFSSEGEMLESAFELRVADCRIITSQELVEATNPWISPGTAWTGGQNGQALDKRRRAFGPAESSDSVPKTGQ